MSEPLALVWPLILVQMVLGLFDILYHHEGTERLAWRGSQRRELRLHAARNLIYAAIFAVLGWSAPQGWLALLLVALLAVEVAVTLWDFVEEDLSRKLPATERVTHTLLALNYGAILVILVPALLAWAGRPTGIELRDYGLWSLFATVASIGCGVFGLREIAAARRLSRMTSEPAGALAAGLPAGRAILVTGGTGFVGRRLVAALVEAGHRVTVLTRDPAKAAVLPAPLRIVTALDQIGDDEHIDAIVNLAGEPIADGPWTRRKRRRILRSRLVTTRAVVALCRRLETRPAVLVSGSAVGRYGLWDEDRTLGEDAPVRPCFSERLCRAWEDAARKAEPLGIRVVRLRIGLVLGTEGGLLSRLLVPFEFGLGGPIGHGRQWMSWIERDDLVRLIVHAVATPGLAGAVNATSPEPVRNAAFAAALGRALGRPAFLRVPAAPLRLALGGFAEELLLGGQRVVPVKALASGFVFRRGELNAALGALVGRAGCRPTLLSAAPAACPRAGAAAPR